jgi:hypothetical protein
VITTAGMGRNASSASRSPTNPTLENVTITAASSNRRDGHGSLE